MASIRQLLVISSLVIACMLIGMLAAGTGLMARKLDVQSQFDSENAAATLALLMSAQPDAGARQRVLDAAFQQGRFARLGLAAPDGTPLFERARPRLQTLGVPDWFAALADVSPHQASRQIAGVGRLSLVLDPGPARDALWTHAVQWSWLALGIVAFWALFVAALLARLRHALEDVVAADADLAQVRETSPAALLDEVAERVAPSVDEQRARVEQLQLELNRDPATGLANRAYFLNELKRRLRDDAAGGVVSGYVLLVRQRDMAQLQEQADPRELHDWLQELGRRLGETLARYPQAHALPARINGTDFAVLFPIGGGPDVMQPIQRLCELLETLRMRLDGGHFSRWAYALTDYAAQCTPKDVLTRLDQGLMIAESAGNSEVQFLSHADREGAERRLGESAWRALITRALAENRLSLDARRIQYEGDTIRERYEATLLLHEADADQAALPGHLFMPAAARLGLSADCDAQALRLALDWLGAHPQAVLVIRVSVPSLLDNRFLPRILQACAAADAGRVARVALEFDAYGLLHHLDTLRHFAGDAKAAGLHLGLRGLGEQTGALRELHQVDFVYVKLGGVFVRKLLSSPGGVQMMVAITQTAIGMGVQVYVDDVDDPAIRRMVTEYGALPRLASTVPAAGA